jgi:hypothetical protein
MLAGCTTGPLEGVAILPTPPEPERAVSLVYVLGPAATEELLVGMEATARQHRTIRLQMVPAGPTTVRAIATVTDRTGHAIACELIVPAAEQELAVAALARQNFTHAGGRPTGRARIEVGYGDAVVAKNWTPEPRLDDLVERVIRNGRRISVVQQVEVEPIAESAPHDDRERVVGSAQVTLD